MFRILVALTLALVSFDAFAVQRYTSTSMTCAAVQAAIRADGAAIMRYTSPRSGLPLYDRYVRNGQFCEGGESIARRRIPASDTTSCPVLACERPQFDVRSGRD